MIRVACEDRERPVDLLHDEHARKLVRQGQSAECGQETGLPPDALVEPIGAADDEIQRRAACVAP